MPRDKTTRMAWIDYRNGDHVLTPDMEKMLAELEAAMPFLTAHPDMGAARRVALQDRDTIQGYLRNRKRNY